MGIRDKLLDFKRRLSDRQMYSIVLLVIAVIAGFGIYHYKAKLNYRNFLENEYNKTFFTLVDDVQDVEISLAKTMVSSKPQQTAHQLTQVWREASSAQANLNQIPVSHRQLQNTSKFLSQVGAFCNTLSSQVIDGKKINSKQWDSLEHLHKLSIDLEKSLLDLEKQIQSGRTMWGELQSQGPVKFKHASKKLATPQMKQINNEFKDYPTLIYDGPFSEHLTKIEPQFLKGKKKISKEKAISTAKDFVGKDKVEQISVKGEGNGKIKTHSILINGPTTPQGSAIHIDVTQKGGHVLYMLNSRPVGKATIKIDKAKDIAKKFLDSRGFENMQDTYYMSNNNTATINFAYSQNGVVMYPDLIKVKVALDNGEIVGFESKGYLMSHKTRNLPVPQISQEQAREMINSRVEVKSIGLAVIPLQSKREIFTYEIKGTIGEREFLTYINAKTGEEEKVLIIIDAPNGTLTM